MEGKKRGTWASLDNNILGVNSSSEASPRNAPASMTSRSLQRTPAVKPTFRRGSALLWNTQLWCHPKITAGFPQKVFVNPIVIIANLGDVEEETDPTCAIKLPWLCTQAVKATPSRRPVTSPAELLGLLPVSAFLQSVFGGCSAKCRIHLTSFLPAQPRMLWRQQRDNSCWYSPSHRAPPSTHITLFNSYKQKRETSFAPPNPFFLVSGPWSSR